MQGAYYGTAAVCLERGVYPGVHARGMRVRVFFVGV